MQNPYEPFHCLKRHSWMVESPFLLKPVYFYPLRCAQKLCLSLALINTFLCVTDIRINNPLGGTLKESLVSSNCSQGIIRSKIKIVSFKALEWKI